jgi:hypothetical protein
VGPPVRHRERVGPLTRRGMATRLHPAASRSHVTSIHSNWPSMAEKCRGCACWGPAAAVKMAQPHRRWGLPRTAICPPPPAAPAPPRSSRSCSQCPPPSRAGPEPGSQATRCRSCDGTTPCPRHCRPRLSRRHVVGGAAARGRAEAAQVGPRARLRGPRRCSHGEPSTSPPPPWLRPVGRRGPPLAPHKYRAETERVAVLQAGKVVGGRGRRAGARVLAVDGLVYGVVGRRVVVVVVTPEQEPKKSCFLDCDLINILTSESIIL